MAQMGVQTMEPNSRLVPTGTVITLVDYNAEVYREKVAARLEECLEPIPEGMTRWIDVQGVANQQTIEALGEIVHLHPLVIEDICTPQRPKLDDYGSYLFIVFSSIESTVSGPIEPQQLSLVLAPHILMTFHQEPISALRQRRDRLRGALGRARSEGADYLAYSVMDGVVDQLFLVVEEMQETLEELEEELTRMSAAKSLETIIDEKREVLLLLKQVVPLVDVVSQLQRTHQSFFSKTTHIYFRDLYDHCLQILDTIKNCRELISSMMIIYLSLANNRLSEVMKVLTIFSTTFAPLTFITGYYGMNFAEIPFLHDVWGWALATALMVVVAVGMLSFFKHRKWL
jgi:magnesium transporter